MPRIALSGSHSTGKSTILNELKQIDEINNRFTFIDEVLRSIKKEGHQINEMGDDNTQKIVMAKFLEHSIIPNSILDRCALDGVVYTTYLYEKNQVKRSTLRIAESIFENTFYDIHFYIEPEFDIVSDGIRSENYEFRNRIAEIFEDYIRLYSIKHVRLKGNVNERVNAFLDTLKKYDDCMDSLTKSATPNLYRIDAWRSQRVGIWNSELPKT